MAAFQGASASELSFSAGELITDVVCLEGEWWRGRYRGQLGHFPALYVELVNDAQKNEVQNDDKSAIAAKVEVETAQSNKSNTGKPPVPSKASKAKLNRAPSAVDAQRRHKSFRARALRKFVGEGADQLSFDEGDQIVVVAECDDGWWRGVCRAREGLFPDRGDGRLRPRGG